MQRKTRRARTGCLTCRARRVKCDEQAPECRRCIAANFACAGYEQRRVAVSDTTHGDYERRRQQRQQSQQGETSSSFSFSSTARPPSSWPTTRDDAAATASLSESPSSPQRVQRDSAATVDNRSIASHQPLLVAFPSGPRRCQVPTLGARHVLGYNQVHLRTLPILFPAEHLSFWQDELLQEAWGRDYLYLTLVALGNAHRAALLNVSENEQDQANGLDTKITAVQLYTDALECLSKALEEAKDTPVILVAALCLMAYFEAFSGNIPAFVGRIQAADYYFTTSLLTDPDVSSHGTSQNTDLTPLRDCLRSLSQTCYITLPLRSFHVTTEQHLFTVYHKTADSYLSSSSPTSLIALHNLVDIVYESHEMQELIWSPIAPYAREHSAQMIEEFERRLESWKTDYVRLIPELDTESALSALLVYQWSTFTMPPPAYTSTTRYTSLAAAHYNFYKARVRWALLLLGIDERRNQLMADFYFYEAMRHAASHIEFFITSVSHDEAGVNQRNSGGSYIPCEALRVSLLPVLHITGLCSPEPRWLEWIRGVCEKIVQEGVLKGHTFATNLESLHMFETQRHNHKHRHGGGGHSGRPSTNTSMSSPSSLPPPLERYPPPAERIICQLIPETDGREFVSFFAAPALLAAPGRDDGDDIDDNDDDDDDEKEEDCNDDNSHVQSGSVGDDDDRVRCEKGLAAYVVIGDARWTCGYGETRCTPIISTYNDNRGDTNSAITLQRFSTEWLYRSQPARDWLSWSQEKGFCMERALQDHINGTRMLLAHAYKTNEVLETW